MPIRLIRRASALREASQGLPNHLTFSQPKKAGPGPDKFSQGSVWVGREHVAVIQIHNVGRDNEPRPDSREVGQCLRGRGSLLLLSTGQTFPRKLLTDLQQAG